MQTGRKSNRVYGVVLYASALSHGLWCTKEDVVSMVHFCELTKVDWVLKYRFRQFEGKKKGNIMVRTWECNRIPCANIDKAQGLTSKWMR